MLRDESKMFYTRFSFTSKHLLPIAAKHASEEQVVGMRIGLVYARALAVSVSIAEVGMSLNVCVLRRARFRCWSAGAMQVETE